MSFSNYLNFLVPGPVYSGRVRYFCESNTSHLASLGASPAAYQPIFEGGWSDWLAWLIDPLTDPTDWPDWLPSYFFTFPTYFFILSTYFFVFPHHPSYFFIFWTNFFILSAYFFILSLHISNMTLGIRLFWVPEPRPKLRISPSSRASVEGRFRNFSRVPEPIQPVHEASLEFFQVPEHIALYEFLEHTLFLYIYSNLHVFRNSNVVFVPSYSSQ